VDGVAGAPEFPLLERRAINRHGRHLEPPATHLRQGPPDRLLAARRPPDPARLDPDLLAAMRFKFFDIFQQWLPREERRSPSSSSISTRPAWRAWGMAVAALVLASLVNRSAGRRRRHRLRRRLRRADRNLSLDTARLLQLPLGDLKGS
jgi:hypothetical protein